MGVDFFLCHHGVFGVISFQVVQGVSGSGFPFFKNLHR